MGNRSSAALTARYCLLQGLYWGMFGSLIAYASVFLMATGFTNTQIGLLVASANTSSVVLQPVLASAVDKASRFTLREVSLVLVGLLGLSTAALACLHGAGLVVVGGLFVLVLLLLQTLQPFVNALGFALNTLQSTANFGVARGAGSLLYSLVSGLLGYGVASFGVILVPLVTMVQAMLLFVTCLFYKVPPTVRTTDASQTASSFGRFVGSNKAFMVLLLGVVFAFTSYQMCTTFLAQIVQHLGGSSENFGFAISMAAVLEMPTMIFFTRISRRINCGTLIKVSGVFFVLKALCYFFARSITLVYVAQWMQPLGFALYMPAAVYYANNMLRPADKVKGHAFMTAAGTAGAVVGAGSGGVLIDAVGFKGMLTAATVLAVVGMLLFWAGARTRRAEEETE